MKPGQRVRKGSEGMVAALVVAGVLGGLLIPDLARMSWLIGETRMLAMAAGGCIGALFAHLLILQRRVQALERHLEPESETVEAPGVEDTRTRQAASRDSSTGATTADQPEPVVASHETDAVDPTPTPAATRQDRVANEPARPGLIQRWLTEGNLPVKIGVLVLFVGVAALLRHALDQGWLAIGIEWRLSGVALAAIAALVFAWRERDRRRTFSLALQGGAIGVLALVVFAAFRLHDLLPALPALAMLVLLTFATAVLSVAQSAPALAVLAVIAGFSAPLLIATDTGNHLVLFGWYALLNLGIFAVAWRQDWPLLNRIGFAFTFVIATAWGVLNYLPEFYAGTQAFLLLFFGIYFLIPVILALYGPTTPRRLPDAVLVFGLPLFAFPLQAALLEGERLPLAFSALVLSLIYLASAIVLLHLRPRPSLGRSHAVLAVGFATLAVPFAFAAPSVALIWALQGAALTWFGIAYRHRFSRLAGVALQYVAAIVWLSVLFGHHTSEFAVLNEFFLGGLAVAVAFTISAWRYTVSATSPRLLGLLTFSALSIWLVNGVVEVELHTAPPATAQLWLLLAGVTAAITAYLYRRFQWAVAGGATGIVLLAGGPLAFVQAGGEYWPLSGFGGLAWGLFVALSWFAQLFLGDSRKAWQAAAATGAHAALVAVLSLSALYLVDTVLQLGAGWLWLAAALPLYLLLAAVRFLERPPLSPAGIMPSATRWVIGAALSVLVIGLLTSLSSTGDSAPLAYVPLLNPLEITQLGALVLLYDWARRSPATSGAMAWLGLLAFAVATWMMLRGVHQVAGIEWSADALLSSRVGQATLSVGWTALAVIAWVSGSRLGKRGLWLAGAVLLGFVLLKLLIVDRTFLSTLAGIVSFLAFGLLSILVGYLAPAPPRTDMNGPNSNRRNLET